MLGEVDLFEVALWTVAAYLAVVSLVRLMAMHRERLLARFRAERQTERRRHAQFVLVRKRRTAAARTAGNREMVD